MQLPSDRLLHECQGLLYKAWAKAFDEHKEVKKETNNGSPDWSLFHAERLKKAKAEEDSLKDLLNEINLIAPLTRK